LEGKDLANPLAMILAAAAILHHAARWHGAACDRASRAIYEAALQTVGSGIKTPDLGGSSGTADFTSAVIERTRTKIDDGSSVRALP
jgi:isocitrate/isopropylmalate dehydrogenase